MHDLRTLIVSAEFWCVLLMVLGAAAVTVGVSMVFGQGYGVLVFGVLCLVGSNVIRRGLIRA